TNGLAEMQPVKCRDQEDAGHSGDAESSDGRRHQHPGYCHPHAVLPPDFQVVDRSGSVEAAGAGRTAYRSLSICSNCMAWLALASTTSPQHRFNLRYSTTSPILWQYRVFVPRLRAASARAALSGPTAMTRSAAAAAASPVWRWACSLAWPSSSISPSTAMRRPPGPGV